MNRRIDTPMKLLACFICMDVRALSGRRTVCRCGATWGQYQLDKVHAFFGGDGVLLDISGRSLETQISEQLRFGDLPDGKGRDVTATILPTHSPTVERLDRDEEQEARRKGWLD